MNDHRESTNLNEIVGIASGNARCDESCPHIIVRLSKHIDWIESIVWPSENRSNDSETVTLVYFDDSIECIKDKKSLTEIVAKESCQTGNEDKSIKAMNILLICVILLLILLCTLLLLLRMFGLKNRKRSDFELIRL